jgi:Na+-transporting methylmalonyl-CoA/oxaloacetate decarboxylase gamma subunit
MGRFWLFLVILVVIVWGTLTQLSPRVTNESDVEQIQDSNIIALTQSALDNFSDPGPQYFQVHVVVKERLDLIDAVINGVYSFANGLLTVPLVVVVCIYGIVHGIVASNLGEVLGGVVFIFLSPLAAISTWGTLFWQKGYLVYHLFMLIIGLPLLTIGGIVLGALTPVYTVRAIILVVD